MTLESAIRSGLVHVAALYRFAPVADPAALRDALVERCRERGILGTLIVAGEGLNGTVAGTRGALDDLVGFIRALDGFGRLDVKWSTSAEPPFHRLKVRLKSEIVTMGVPGIDPNSTAGTYVAPRDWNALIADPETVVIDTRNAYETKLGSFERAIDPRTGSFRDFPAWAAARRDEFAGRRVAMFCTGGIRCEKATAFMKRLGVEEVFHLEGGILSYLEEVPAAESLWRGECFVFDERVSVGHGLEGGEAELCRACRHPLTLAERAGPAYVEGISCPHCAGTRSEADRARYAERHRQVRLARARGRPSPMGRRA
ncbi:MAG: rhodanese-related sulfurtransferase [Rhizobiaceae bacterium]|nr:rhodanese-related sulfurtransferase [Rhizobiaceae bacterium]MCV0406937.1 rhodanese-related sulfurtransferase [Rhizobiaceae bacterium]